ncbi:hypothetical protein C8R45DRAFT_1023572 [Mycena sanguinolenta]|nr:hypothetical protein C8R45DRAFT_1023572 [Mycena sanguinolenta]
MCLTAGRIWYMSREARNAKLNALHKRYHTVIAMILESGALYCAVLLLEVLALSLDSQFYAVSIFQGICYGLVEQMVNITPTLIFARVGLGYCQWRQDSAPSEVQIPKVRTPRRREEGILEDISSELIEIK